MLFPLSMASAMQLTNFVVLLTENILKYKHIATWVLKLKKWHDVIILYGFGTCLANNRLSNLSRFQDIHNRRYIGEIIKLSEVKVKKCLNTNLFKFYQKRPYLLNRLFKLADIFCKDIVCSAKCCAWSVSKCLQCFEII